MKQYLITIYIFLFVSLVSGEDTIETRLKNCEDYFEEFKACALKSKKPYTTEYIDSFCESFNSEECQDFYDNPIYWSCYRILYPKQIKYAKKDFEELKNSESINKFELFTSLDAKYGLGKLLCDSDQSQTYFRLACPFVHNMINYGNPKVLDKYYFNDIFYGVCRYDECKLGLQSFYEGLISSYENGEYFRYRFGIKDDEELSIAKDLLGKLSSNTCENADDHYSDRCGPGYGVCNIFRPINCCSKTGHCGFEVTDCNPKYGCQEGYGICSWATVRCGPENDYEVCNNYECCGPDGICGIGEDYCGKGCLSEFGECYSKYSSKEELDAKNTKYIEKSISRKCGSDVEKSCGEFECCSADGICVMAYPSKSECEIINGCQSPYGICYNTPVKIETTETTTTTTSTTTTSTTTTSTTTTSTTTTNSTTTNSTTTNSTTTNSTTTSSSTINTTNKLSTRKSTTSKKTTGTTKTETTTLKKQQPISTVSGKCGPNYGACAKPDQCCSEYGYCGTTDEYCGNGCQNEFGICFSSSSTTTEKSKTTTVKVPISTVSDRCGPNFGACAESNQCCSKYGYCGTTNEYCGNGCQNEFGICFSSSSTTTGKSKTTTVKVPISTVSDRCGPNFGACAKSNQCCSRYGYCGTTNEYCGNGCQNEFGICFSSSSTTTKKSKTTTKKSKTTTKKSKTTTKKSKTTTKKSKTTTVKVPTSTVSDRCGPNYGACSKSGYCCSKYNYCGKTDEYCGTGCQPKYGICK